MVAVAPPTETPVRTLEELVAVVGEPNEVAAHKVQDRLHDLHREWLAASPLLRARHLRRRRQPRRLAEG